MTKVLQAFLLSCALIITLAAYVDKFPLTEQAKLAVHVVIEQDNKILLLYRSHTGYKDGTWSVAGGKVDCNETMIEAAIREAYEELDIVIAPEDLQYLHTVQKRKISSEDPEWIIFYFKVSRWSGTLINKEPNKHLELAWFAWDKLPQNILDHQKHALCEWMSGKTISFFDPNGVPTW